MSISGELEGSAFVTLRAEGFLKRALVVFSQEQTAVLTVSIRTIAIVFI